MRFTDDDYEEERSGNKGFLYMILLMSVVILAVTGIVFWVNYDKRSGSGYQLAKEQAQARSQEAGALNPQTSTTKPADPIISGSTLTSDQLSIWDLSELDGAPEESAPASSKNGTVTNQTTGETLVDGSSNSGSENSAGNLAGGKTSVYDMPEKEEEKETQETSTEEETTEEGTYMRVTLADGTQEQVELNKNLARNDYVKSRFVYKNPVMSYYINGKQASWFGVNISSKQGIIDFKKLKKAGCDYVMLQVGARGYSSGELVLDAKLKEYMTGAKNAGLDIGVSFFSQAVTEDEIDEEVQTLLEVIKDYPVTYPVVFDMEEILGDMARVDGLDMDSRTSLALRFMEKVKKAGYTPMLYGNKEWLVMKLDLEALADYDIWLSQEGNYPDYPYEFTMWQYKKAGSIDGIPKGTGMNISFVNYSQK